MEDELGSCDSHLLQGFAILPQSSILQRYFADERTGGCVWI